MIFSPKNKFSVVMSLVTLIGFLFGVLTIKFQTAIFASLFFGWLCVGSFLIFQIKCPSCQKPIAYKGRWGVFRLYAGFANRRCKNCGFDLTLPQVSDKSSNIQ